MDAKDIQRYLSLVGKELQAMGVQEPVQLLLIGGGYMLTQVQNRTVTGDVDAVWVYPEVYADSEVYRLFRAAVELVADDEGLEPSWLNTAVILCSLRGHCRKGSCGRSSGWCRSTFLQRISFWLISLSLRERRMQQIFRPSARCSASIRARRRKKL